MRVASEVLYVHFISPMYTQLILKSKAESFEIKLLHGYVHKNSFRK